MPDIIPTVKIVSPVTDENPLGYIVINESDRGDDDVLFDDSPKAPSKKTS